MPSRNPGKSARTKPRITSHHTETVVVTRVVSRVALCGWSCCPAAARPTIMNKHRCRGQAAEASAV